jgi:hypothetical protein
VRTVLASFLFVDVVGFSKVSAAEQHAFKAELIGVLQRGLAMLQPQDYRLRDTGDGALISFLTNPEHALYMALFIANDCGGEPAPGQVLSLKNLRTGINLGTVKESLDVESRPNFVGDGINAAQRIMDFAQPGQVTASRSFMESMSLLDVAYGGIFGSLGPRADKHGRQHELFSVTPNELVLERIRVGLVANRTGGLDFDLDTPVALAVPPPMPTAVTAPVPMAAAAPASAPLPPSAAVEPSWLPSQAAPEELPADEDTGPSTLNKVLLGVAATVVVVAGIVLGVRYMERDTRSGAPAVSTAVPSPAASAAPAAVAPTPATPSATTTPTPAPALPPAPEATPTPAPATAAIPPPAVTEPPAATARAVAPERASTPAANAAEASRSKPQEPASRSRRQTAAVTANNEQPARHERAADTPAPAAAPTPAPERSDGRCSRIMQKASVGEPLSSEEKRELANSCR